MKLTEMNTEQLTRTLCALAGPVCRIAEDVRVQAAMAALAEAGLGELPLNEAVPMLIANLVPVMLGTHAEEVWQIAAALTGKQEAEIRAQSGLQTIDELRRVWSEELIDFFLCAGCTGKAKC